MTTQTFIQTSNTEATAQYKGVTVNKSFNGRHATYSAVIDGQRYESVCWKNLKKQITRKTKQS